MLVGFLALLQQLCVAQVPEDRLKQFYHRIKKGDTTYCPDNTKLLPACNECIPGLQKGSGSDSCNEYIPASRSIRDEIKKLTDERYGDKPVVDRPFGLYPYLEKPDFMSRQITFGKMMSAPTSVVRNVMDIGAYYNPINLFMSPEVCPASVIVIEPILDALSVLVPCASDATKKTHIMFLPITFKYYMNIASSLPKPETVVCIGCDSHYGPNRKMLETAFERPYTLYLEYPSEYVHNTPFKRMNGEDPGEELSFIRKFQPKTNETQYTKRVMKIIQYSKV